MSQSSKEWTESNSVGKPACGEETSEAKHDTAGQNAAFKVGDRVVLVDTASVSVDNEEGATATVTEADPEGDFYLAKSDRSGAVWAFHGRNFCPLPLRAASVEVRVTDPKTGGQKGSKPERYDLLPWDALDEVARVYGFGATKYDDHNWLKGYKWSLTAAALARHFSKMMQGEDRDPESGCLHAAHIAWHCLTWITFFLRKLGTDDRMPPARIDKAA
jgi:hypothetical protein